MKSQKQQTTQSSQQPISPNLVSSLNQLVTYNRNNFVNLTLTQLKPSLQIQVRKITNKLHPVGHQLLLIVLNNHIKAIFDLSQINSTNGLANNSSRRSFNQKNGVVVYEDLGNQFFQSDQQLNKLIILNSDFAKAQGAIQLAIKYYTNKNYRFKSNKIIQSRVRMLEILLALLRMSENGHATIPKQIPPLPKLGHKNTSFHELQVSHVRLIVEQLDQKVYQLSTISQQIPQLQTFKRTLDLTMPQHNAYLTKIVDVLIQLHHKINKLISRRPQKLLRQIQSVEQQCLIIQTALVQFLQKFQSTQQVQITLKPIYFDQRTNKSPDHFRKIQKNIVKCSQIIIQCMNMQAQATQRILQIKSLVQVFWNLIAGMEQYQRQWKIYKNRAQKSNDQEQIIQMLQLCLKFVNDRIDKLTEQFQIQRQNLIDANVKNIQFLEQDINRMSKQMEQQHNYINQLEKQNQLLRADLDSFQNKFKQLLKKHEHDAQDYLAKLNILEKRQKNYKDKIQSLQTQNQQKKVMITNITNDLKRVMKQSQTSHKADQKNKDLNDYIDKLGLKISALQTQLSNTKQDNSSLHTEKQQNQRNTDLLIKKLDEANRRINDLENDLVSNRHNAQRQKNNYKQEIQQLERKIKRLGQESTTTYQIKVKQYQKKQSEQRQAIIKKDEKISELNDKILDLNTKLNEILNNYKNMQFEVKRKQKSIQDMTSKIVQLQNKNTGEHKDLLRVYQANQKQLANALSQIDRCRNKIVPDLQAQIRRRQSIIAQMQRIINQLQQKHSSILSQQQSNQQMRRILDDLNNQLRSKQNQLQKMKNNYDNSLRDKDAKIRDLEYNVNVQISKANQFEIQLNQRLQDQARYSQDQDRIRFLENQNTRIKAEYQNKLRDQQNLLKQAQSKLQKARQLQNQLKNQSLKLKKVDQLQQSLKRAKQQITRSKQPQPANSAHLAKISTLESSLNTKNRQLSDLEFKYRNLQTTLRDQQKALQKNRQLQNQLRNALLKLNKLGELEQQLLRSRQQLARLKQIQSSNSSQNTKIIQLETSLNTKNRQLSDLQLKCRNLEIVLRDQQRQLQKTKNLIEQLRSKQNQIFKLREQIGLMQQNVQLSAKLQQSSRQIQYLREKVRSLEDLIDIFVDQHRILQQKLRKYKQNESSSSTINNTTAALTSNYNKLLQQHTRTNTQYQKIKLEHTKLLLTVKTKDDQQQKLKSQLQEANKYNLSPIHNHRIYEDTPVKQKQRQKQRQRYDQLERQNNQNKNKLLIITNKYNQSQRLWKFNQRQYTQQIRILKQEILSLQNKVKNYQIKFSNININSNSNTSQSDKYYLRTQGQKLEDLLKGLSNGNNSLTNKLQQILSNSRRSQPNGHYSQLHVIIKQNKLLVQGLKKVIQQKQQLSNLVRDYPHPDFVIEFAFRLITYFSQIHPESAEGKAVWQQLQRIRQSSAGQKFFIVLQQFTKFTLQECAIQVYRRQLKQKSSELQVLKSRLNSIIEEVIASERIVYQKTALTQSRIRMFKGKYQGRIV